VEQSAAGTEIEIDVRGRLSKARVVKMPFYKRGQDAVSG
jgi:glycine cleavage system aminomethyltransferase T